MNSSNYQKYLLLIAPYGITVSSLYLFGYWSIFGINIFEYISLTDVIKVAIHQLAYYSAFIVLGIIIAELFISPFFKSGEGADLPEAKFVKKYWRFFTLFILSYAIYIGLFTNNPVRWFAVSMLIFPIISIALNRIDPMSGMIKKQSIRHSATNLIAMVLLFSFGWGTVDALIKRNNNKSLIINGIPSDKAYIGRTNSHVFFWLRKDKRIEIISSAKIESMSFIVKPGKPSFSFLLEDTTNLTNSSSGTVNP